MNNNEPDIYESEATIIGDVPEGRKAGDKIKLIISVKSGQTIPIYDKWMEVTYTYEWKE